MLVAILSSITILVVCLCYLFGSTFTTTYGSELEKYIATRNPTDAGDVERLIREFDKKVAKRFL